jgi:hypothetical protein
LTGTSDDGRRCKATLLHLRHHIYTSNRAAPNRPRVQGWVLVDGWSLRLVQQSRIVIVEKLLRVAEQAFQFREMRRGVELVLEEKGAPC